MARILAFAGSLRKESFNKKLVKLAARKAEDAGASVTVIDLRDFTMPIYDEDLETTEGLPSNARRLKDLMMTHQGLLLACPEYNSSMSAVFKNTIDWASRPAPGETALACFNGKIAALLSASPGALGGMRGLIPVRSLLENIGVMIIPETISVPKANEAFSGEGHLKDPRQQEKVTKIAIALTTLLKKVFV